MCIFASPLPPPPHTHTHILHFVRTLHIAVVVPPQYADFPVTADIPHGEGQSLDRGHGLHVEADGGDGADHLVQFDLVQNRRLACNRKIVE